MLMVVGNVSEDLANLIVEALVIVVDVVRSSVEKAADMNSAIER